ncbi:MAG: glycosyltransferase [Pseudomonadota bacterium]
MRILHVISSLNPIAGGPQEGLRQFCMAAQAKSNTVEIVTLDDPSAPWLINYCCKVHALGPCYGKYRYTPNLRPWLKKNAHHYDSVVVQGLWQYHSLTVWRVLKKNHIPYVIYTHGMLGPWFKQNFPLKHLKKWMYWPWVEYRVLRDASAVLFTCEEERVQARKSFWLYKCKEAVPGYGIAEPPGDSAAQISELYNIYPQLREKKIVLFLGRVHPIKGCDMLVEAFSRVAHLDSALHLVIAGPDNSNIKMELTKKIADNFLVKDRITWTGMISGSVKWGALSAADAFVLPSHHENFGISVVEAMARGVPVLVSNKVNIWKEIEADGAGLIANDDLAGTISLLKQWITLPQKEKDLMRKYARASFEKRFHINSSSERLINILINIRQQRERVT